MSRRHHGGRPHRSNGHANGRRQAGTAVRAPAVAGPCDRRGRSPDRPRRRPADRRRPLPRMRSMRHGALGPRPRRADDGRAGHGADRPRAERRADRVRTPPHGVARAERLRTARRTAMRPGTAGCTAPQLRRFIKSRPYVPMHELRRRFGIDGGEDDVTPVDLARGRIFVGLPPREGGAPRRAAPRRRHRLRAVARPAQPDRRRPLPDASRRSRLIAVRAGPRGSRQPRPMDSGALDDPGARSRNGGSSRNDVGDDRLAARRAAAVRAVRGRRRRRDRHPRPRAPRPPLPARRDGLPPGRPGRRAVRRRERLGQGRPAERRGRGAGDRRDPRTRASSSASWRSSTARRTRRRSSRSRPTETLVLHRDAFLAAHRHATRGSAGRSSPRSRRRSGA